MSRFVDTSYFLALLIPNDENHAAAVAIATEGRELLITTDFVLIEVANHLSPPPSRGVFARFFYAISNEPRMNIVAASREWMRRGTDLYNARSDKGWSLTDCISFEVMREHGLTEALTADHHFTQAGFSIARK